MHQLRGESHKQDIAQWSVYGYESRGRRKNNSLDPLASPIRWLGTGNTLRPINDHRKKEEKDVFPG